MSFSRIFVLGFIFGFIINANISAQQSPSDYLLTAFEAGNTQALEAQLEFLSRNPYRLPLAEEIELRYSNNENTLEDARYRLRLRPNNPWKIRRNNALFNALEKELSIEQQLIFKENLYDRYHTLLEYIFASKKTALLEQRYQLASKKLALFRENPQAELFDARDFVDAKLETVERLEEWEEANNEFINIQREIQLTLNSTDLKWHDFELISIEQIEELSKRILTQSIPSTELQLYQQRIEVAKIETSKERADFDIGFVEARLAPNLQNDDNQLGFAFGITIPIFRDNKDQIAERILNELELRNEYSDEASKDSVMKVLEFQFLQDQLSQHQKLKESVRKTNVDVLGDNLARSEAYNPIALLELEEGKLKLEQLLMRSQERVLEQFIEVLFIYDAMLSKPLINYLHKDLEIIE